jgi:peptide/nickel transport system permease protein
MKESKATFQHQPEGKGWRPVAGESQWQIAWRALRHNPQAMFGLAGLVLLILMTLLSPLLMPYDPTGMDYDHLLETPGKAHPWGTDDLGRDILSRVLSGGRESLRVAFIAIALGMGGGVVVGLLSGFYGGWVDNLIQRIVEIMMAFPTILLLLSIVAALGPSLGTVLIAIGISSIPGYSRLVRGSVLAAKNFEYVTAARLIGATNRRIMFRHILPNIVAPIIIYSTLGLGGAIMMTAGLSYVGLGAQPPSPEWGAMLNYGRSYLRDAWWMSFFPGLAIFVAVLCINILGDGLRDALDPKLRI